jgi:hypothetical protein
MKIQSGDFFCGSCEEAGPDTLWARAGRYQGEYGIYVGQGLILVDFVPEARVPQNIADIRSAVGGDNPLIPTLEIAARDLQLLHSSLPSEIAQNMSKKVLDRLQPIDERNLETTWSDLQRKDYILFEHFHGPRIAYTN